ncbi:hypothetical protein K466DRAFT_497246 [Polyporus arcularius HHB13444]|uniref:Uncharacterized protein n=1 Tax=Polyporus arcularius HHB13444 TaxID=1314778 RepID=A0A5C3P4E7_9APHY|nr:hypothetical protein K466DRAFT_497246 [Polyporus arcularius HHB13444]
MKPLPEAPEPGSVPQVEPAPEDIKNPVDLVARGHALPARASKTASQLEDPSVKDLGWRADTVRAPSLIKGMSNDDIFQLIRRFNKQIQHVREIPPPPPGFLDLEITDDEEFSPDKLRANLERLYMTVIVGMAAFGKHIARLRSWNEPRRTARFCAAYFIAWCLSLLPALLVTTLLVLMFHPPARQVLFPPAPLAAVSASTGNLQIPRSGTLGSHDSLSGAPEAHQGEAVEQEASHFVASFAAISAGTVMGQGGAPKRKRGEARADEKDDAAGEMETEVDKGARASDDSFGDGLPDPSDFTLQAKNVKDTANSDGAEDPAAKVAKKSVEGAMWEKMRPIMRILADLADTWERFGNALEPVPPFPKYTARLRLAAILVPILLASFFVTAEMVVDGTTFLVGVVFFSGPVTTKLIHTINHRFPHWQRLLELRRSLLKGVPTNAQLTLTLLRLAEEAKAPLPPPPVSRPDHTAAAVETANPAAAHPPQAADALKQHDFAFDTKNHDIDGVDADHPAAYTDSEEGTYVDGEGTDRESVEGEDEHKDDGGEKKKKRRGSKLVGFMRKTTRAGVGSLLGVDHLKAKIGNENAKRRLGAVAPPADVSASGKSAAERVQDDEVPDEDIAEDAFGREGPTSFSARVHGKKGRLLLVTGAASPCLAWVTEKPLRAALSAPSKVPGKGGKEEDGIDAEWTVGLGDIVSLRKMGGFGWKGRLVVGWATGRDVVDGLEIVDQFGHRKVITAIRGRDELFNRLIAMGGKYWECL